MDLRDSVIASLEARPGIARCDLCIAMEIKAAPQSVWEVFRMLSCRARFHDIRQDSGRCYTCGKLRLVHSVSFLSDGSADTSTT